jgi:hypothetical protein
MLVFLTTLLAILPSILSRADVELENLALRHQIGVLQRSLKETPENNRNRPPFLGFSVASKRLWLGIAWAFACFGLGRFDGDNRDAPRLPARLAT